MSLIESDYTSVSETTPVLKRNRNYVTVSETVLYIKWDIRVDPTESEIGMRDWMFKRDYECTQIAQKNGMCLLLVLPEDELGLIERCMTDNIALIYCWWITAPQNNQWIINGSLYLPGSIMSLYDAEWTIGASQILY